jgi:hypothetical protein
MRLSGRMVVDALVRVEAVVVVFALLVLDGAKHSGTKIIR